MKPQEDSLLYSVVIPGSRNVVFRVKRPNHQYKCHPFTGPDLTLVSWSDLIRKA